MMSGKNRLTRHHDHAVAFEEKPAMFETAYAQLRLAARCSWRGHFTAHRSTGW
ncbi:MAG: hypothetical protein R2932_43230 [Caldilineaceae bacterium]